MQIAEITHAANRLYSRHAGSKTKQRWNRLDSGAHKAVEQGVLYALGHPDCTPEEIHQHWCDTMVRAGWTPGGVVDVVAKVHANICPWDDLPEREQLKDKLFLAIVRAVSPERVRSGEGLSVPATPPLGDDAGDGDITF